MFNIHTLIILLTEDPALLIPSLIALTPLEKPLKAIPRLARPFRGFIPRGLIWGKITYSFKLLANKQRMERSMLQVPRKLYKE